MRGGPASHIDQGRHSRFTARVLQRPGPTIGLGGLPGFFGFIFKPIFSVLQKPENRHYVIAYCHRLKLDLNSQNMTIITLNYMTLDTNSILFP